MASKTSNSIASYYDDEGTKQSLSGYPNRIKLIYSYKYNKDGKYTLSWEIQADSTTEDTGKKWTYYYTASIKVGSTAEKSLLSSTTGFKQGETIASGTAQVTQNTTCRLVAKSYIAQKTSANLATITVDVAIPKMPYLKVQYYSNYATEAFDGAANAVSADSNVIVRTAYFYKSQTYASGLHNYKDKGDGTYLARTGYTATGNWGSSTSGGTLLSESAGDKTGAALATHFGKNISSDNATQKLYAQWTPKEYTITLNKNGGSGGTDKTWLLYNTQWQNSDNEAITSIGSVPTLNGYTFAGYYTDKEGGTKIINANKTFVSGKLTFTTSNKTLYAHWTLNKATIHYYANGGTAKGDYKLDSSKRALNADGDLIATTINYGSSSNVYDVGTLFSPPTGYHTPLDSTDYYASGWRVGSGTATTYATQYTFNPASYITKSSQTLKFYARWLNNTYTITYKGNGSTSGSTAASSHTYDVAKKLTANGFAKKYTVTFNANGGSTSKTSATSTYTFKGWNKNTGGTSTSYTNQQSVTNLTSTNGDNVNLYAQWDNSTAAVVLPTASQCTRTGYTLLGFSTSNTATTASYKPGASYTPTKATTLYAVWSLNYSTISYDCYGTKATINSSDYKFDATYKRICSTTKTNKTIMGTNNVFYHTVNYGSSATTKTFNGFGLHPPTGHYFTKWLSGDTGTLLSQNTSYSYDKFSTDSQTANDQPCWLTAQFSPKQLKIIFNKNDGTGNTASQTVTYGTTNQAFGKNTDGTYIWGNTGDFGKWSRTGHTLLGWSKSKTATSATWSPYNGIASSWIESNTTENTALSELNLYAVWKLINFTVTFNAQGGTVSPTSKTVTYESTYGDLPTPTKTGNTFKGWYTASSGGTKITSSTTVTITADQTLYAQWTVNSYTNKVRHYQQRDPGVDSANSHGWKFVGETTFSANYGSTVTVPQNQVQTYDGHYNTGSANSDAWDWIAKDIGKDTFVQPANAITIQYYYNGYILTVKYKTGKVDIGTLSGTSLTTSKLNGTDVFYEHSDSYGNQFNDGSGLMNYNDSTGIFLRKYGYRVPSGSEWRNVNNTSKTCTQDGSISTQSVASNLGVSLKTSNQTVIVEPNWQKYNLVKIYNGSSWVNAVPMLYDGSSWQETIPQVYKNDTDKWKRCGP